MINYLKSETYRLMRKKGLHLTGIICYLLLVASAFILYTAFQQDPNFPYGTSHFYYANVIGSGALVIAIGFIYNTALTGRDFDLIKQSVSFGISRNTIFWSKLILTLSYFLIICAIGILIMVGLGESFLISEIQTDSIKNFVIASINMLPLILSGFVIIHTLKMLRFDDIYIILFILFVFIFSGDILRLLLRPITGLNELYRYSPDMLLNENLLNYMNQSAQFSFSYWLTGFVICTVVLLFGLKRFANQDIN